MGSSPSTITQNVPSKVAKWKPIASALRVGTCTPQERARKRQERMRLLELENFELYRSLRCRGELDTFAVRLLVPVWLRVGMREHFEREVSAASSGGISVLFCCVELCGVGVADIRG
jgi:hypothetical protein